MGKDWKGCVGRMGTVRGAVADPESRAGASKRRYEPSFAIGRINQEGVKAERWGLGRVVQPCEI